MFYKYFLLHKRPLVVLFLAILTYSNNFFSGDGGDELFGGYTFRYKKFLELTNENSTTEEKIVSYLNCHERDWVPDQELIFGDQWAEAELRQATKTM